MLYHNTAYRYYWCPKCKYSLRRASQDNGGNDGCVVLFMYITLLPIFLIIWGIKFLVKYHHKKHMIISSYGEEVIRCRKCKSYVAFVTSRRQIDQYFGFNDQYIDFMLAKTGTRLLSEKEVSELKKVGRIK